MAKITFKAKVLFEDTTDDEAIITYEQINNWLQDKKAFAVELVLPWDNSAEPTIIIKRKI